MFPYGVVDLRDLPEKFRGHSISSESETVMEVSLNEPVNAYLAPSSNGERLPAEGLDLKEHLTNLEYSLIKQALDEANGIVAHAAKRLHMRRTTLVEKMRKYGLQRSGSAPGV